MVARSRKIRVCRAAFGSNVTPISASGAHRGASQRVQEAKQIFLLGWSQPVELLSYFTGFAFVAINRIPQGDRIAVVHEAGVRSKSPEWSSSDLVPSIMDRLIGKAAAIHDLVYLIKRNLRRFL